MAKFSFVIPDTKPDQAYGLVWTTFVALHKKQGIRKENRPQSFSYQTGWARGRIALTKDLQGTRLIGSVNRQMSLIFMTIIAVIVGFIIYDPLDALKFISMVLFVVLTFDYYFGGKRRKTFGIRLCNALQGTNYQQHN